MAPSVDQPQPELAEPPAADPAPDVSVPSLLNWVHHALTPLGQAPARHHLFMLNKLEDIATGRIDRLMLLMPPGHSKSTFASKLFPAWWFARHPGTSIIAASHTADLASYFGRETRDLVREHGDFLGYSIIKDDRGAARWRTTNRGDYYACGVRGPITGRRADLVLIDDPVRSHMEADSAGSRESLWNWYRSDLGTRLKPGGRVILIMTRWHQDDLGGRLLQNDPSWTIVKLPAIADEDDPLGRRPGEALWPEWESVEALDRKRTSSGLRVWQAQFQQNPTSDIDALFAAARVQVLDHQPAIAREIRAWDLAATLASEGRDPDWTVGLKLAVTKDNHYLVTDIVRLRAGPTEVNNVIAATASQDGPSVTIGLPQDPGQAGKQQIAWLTARLAGHRVRASPETGSKLLRAQPAAAAVDAGMLSLLRAPWNRDFIEELRDFPQGRKDDQVDALSRAFSLVNETATQPRRLHMPLMAR